MAFFHPTSVGIETKLATWWHGVILRGMEVLPGVIYEP
jgi:hypothetical protein